MKIYLATDHAGFELKEKVKAFLQGLEYDVEDCGVHEMNPDDDYPDFKRERYLISQLTVPLFLGAVDKERQCLPISFDTYVLRFFTVQKCLLAQQM